MPATCPRHLAALRRTFERDKAELREFGVPILTITDSAGEVMGYQMKRDSFYLPYLSLIQDAHRTSPEKVDRYGYRALPELAFEADELTAVAEAAQRVAQLGDPATRQPRPVGHAEAGLRPARGRLGPGGVSRSTPASPLLPQQISWRSWTTRSAAASIVTIEYHTFGSDVQKSRVVSPYGLFFLGSHWYLAAREDASGPVKNFRVSRISSAEVNGTQPDTPDFDIPAGFDLRAHSASRQAWELGDAGSIEAVVDFRGSSGPTVAARRLGERRSRCPDEAALPGAPGRALHPLAAVVRR